MGLVGDRAVVVAVAVNMAANPKSRYILMASAPQCRNQRPLSTRADCWAASPFRARAICSPGCGSPLICTVFVPLSSLISLLEIVVGRAVSPEMRYTEV
jgi:hypothetical protein